MPDGVNIRFNTTATAARIYGTGTQTIDGVAAATGVPLSAGARCRYFANTASTWGFRIDGRSKRVMDMQSAEQNRPLNAQLSPDHWNIVLAGLNRIEHGIARPVYDSIIIQLRQQSQQSSAPTTDRGGTEGALLSTRQAQLEEEIAAATQEEAQDSGRI